MLDDFWGTSEWDRFEESMQRVFPERRIVELEEIEPIMHTVYDLTTCIRYPASGLCDAGRPTATTVRCRIGEGSSTTTSG